MSQRNGDKARFGKEQKKKLLRRKRTSAVQQSLVENTKSKPVPASKTAGGVDQDASQTMASSQQTASSNKE